MSQQLSPSQMAKLKPKLKAAVHLLNAPGGVWGKAGSSGKSTPLHQAPPRGKPKPHFPPPPLSIYNLSHPAHSLARIQPLGSGPCPGWQMPKYKELVERAGRAGRKPGSISCVSRETEARGGGRKPGRAQAGTQDQLCALRSVLLTQNYNLAFAPYLLAASR